MTNIRKWIPSEYHIRRIKDGLHTRIRKLVKNPEQMYLDADGYYWYSCVICNRELYSEWTVGGARVISTGEWVSFCVHHNPKEIDRVVNMIESELIDMMADKPKGN